MAPKKSGLSNHLEPIGSELLEAYPEIMQKIINAGWYHFCCNFQGYPEKVSMLFAKNFDCFKNQVGRVLIYVTEQSIGLACHLPMHGERWSKKGEIYEDMYKHIFLPKLHDPNWSQGISTKWLKEEWREVLTLFHKYITDEG
jgi:hypothetical protein